MQMLKIKFQPFYPLVGQNARWGN